MVKFILLTIIQSSIGLAMAYLGHILIFKFSLKPSEFYDNEDRDHELKKNEKLISPIRQTVSWCQLHKEQKIEITGKIYSYRQALLKDNRDQLLLEHKQLNNK